MRNKKFRQPVHVAPQMQKSHLQDVSSIANKELTDALLEWIKARIADHTEPVVIASLIVALNKTIELYATNNNIPTLVAETEPSH